jgi:hypothetical protein
MKTVFVICSLLVVSCRAATVVPTRGSSTPLTNARDVLARAAAGQRVPDARVGSLSLDGYNFHSELNVGEGVRVIVFSKNRGGALLGFHEDGSILFEHETAEIVAFTACDLDADGRLELFVDEFDGVGVGLQLRNYHLYAFRRNAIEEIWKGQSVEQWTPPSDAADAPVNPEKQNYGFVQPLSGGFRHVTIDAIASSWTSAEFSLQGGFVTKRGTDSGVSGQ